MPSQNFWARKAPGNWMPTLCDDLRWLLVRQWVDFETSTGLQMPASTRSIVPHISVVNFNMSPSAVCRSSGWPLSRPDTMKFPDNFLTIRGTCDHFNWYSYHARTTSVKVNDQTVKLIFNDNDFIVKNQCHQQQHYNYYESFWAIFHDKIFSLIIPWHFHDFWWNSWHFPDQVFQTSGHPGSCWFGYIEDQNCELRTSKLISSWSMLPPELKKISLTVGQFSSQLKMKMFLCIHYASAQPPHCNYYNCALLIHMNTVQLYNIAVSNGIIENASSKWIW